MALLEINNLNAFYGMAQSLHDVSLSVEKGEITGVIGPNGAGKSTLLDSIIGLTKITGTISLDGKAISGHTPAAIVRLGVGYAPERANLFPYMAVRDNLLVGGYTARQDIEANLKLVHGLFPVLKERQYQEAGTLSGGERQMVSLGRALMTSPQLLMVDEPTIGLAPKVFSDISTALRRLNSQTGLTIIITEQNVNFAMSLAEKLHVLETGSIQMSGTVDEIKSDPRLNEAYFGQT